MESPSVLEVMVDPPQHVDFVVMAVNQAERLELKKLLSLNKRSSEGDLSYHWNYVEDGNRMASVVMIHFFDVHGPGEGQSWTRKVANILQPNHILVLGTAGGLSRDDCKVNPGDVVLSYYLHYGTIAKGKANPLRPRRILPPSEKLYRAAYNVIERLQNQNPTQNFQIFHDREMLSGSSLETVKSDPVLQNFVKTFPRLAAVEMEAGGVAHGLWEEWEKERGADYIVIKGISDVHDYSESAPSTQHLGTPSVSTGKEPSPPGSPSAVVTLPQQNMSVPISPISATGNVHFNSPEEVAANKKQREENKNLASQRSAFFAKELILEILRSGDYGRRAPLKRLLPKDDINLQNKQCAGVLHQVSPLHYSAITSHNVAKLFQEPVASKMWNIFTVCGLEPYELWKTLQGLYKAAHRGREGTVEELASWAQTDFPHFALFSGQKDFCVRILLLGDDWSKRLSPENWDLFERLNGSVPCWGALRNVVRHRTQFLTDYCIIANHLLLDYYYESHTLLLSHVHSVETSKPLLELKNLFDTERSKNGGEYFIPPETLFAQAHAQLQKISKRRLAHQAGP